MVVVMMTGLVVHTVDMDELMMIMAVSCVYHSPRKERPGMEVRTMMPVDEMTEKDKKGLDMFAIYVLR